jgi:uncharacterized protein YqjF (DUF2071 family)
VTRLAEGRQLVVVYVGGSEDGLREAEFAEAVRDMKPLLARQAAQRELPLSIIGVSLDWEVEKSYARLHSMGAWDEVVLGNNWINVGAQHYLWRRPDGQAQVTAGDRVRAHDHGCESRYDQFGEERRSPGSGWDAIVEWVRNGAPLPAQGSARTLRRRQSHGHDPRLVVTPRVFLTGEWRYLAMLNYRVDSSAARALVPRGTTLDRWQGATYVSLVGFLFRDTRVLGVPVPLHRDFEEVNLRFYVRRESAASCARGVTFISEIVPRRAIAAVARLAYNEPYVALPMRHAIGAGERGRGAERGTLRVATARGMERARRRGSGTAAPLASGSEAEFITEHYWGYTRQRDGGTVEYHVDAPALAHLDGDAAAVHGDLAELYGAALGDVLRRPPDSAFLAEGSAIAVHMPERLKL